MSSVHVITQESVDEALEEQSVVVEAEHTIGRGNEFVFYIPAKETVIGPLVVTERQDDQKSNRTSLKFDKKNEKAIYKRQLDSNLRLLKESLEEETQLNEDLSKKVRRELNDSTEQISLSSAAAGNNNKEITENPSLRELSKMSFSPDASHRDYSGVEEGELQLNNIDFRDADFSYADLEDASFKDADLRGVDFRGANLKNVDFRGAKLARADFRGANLTDATMDGVLRNCKFEDAILDDADLDSATTKGADFSRTKMQRASIGDSENAVFDNSDLRRIKITDVDLSNASLRNCNFKDTDMSSCTLKGAVLDEANLEDTDFREATIEGASFKHTNLKGAKFDSQTAEKVDFSGADLTDSHFRGVVFDDARFNGAILAEADFRGADLSGAVMINAKASEAKFQNANLEKVVFDQAELFGTSFAGAAMYGAMLSSARIGGDTDFHGEPTGKQQIRGQRHGVSLLRKVQAAIPVCSPPSRDQRRVIYDPAIETSIPDGTTDEPVPLAKAMSVYKSLETVMDENSLPDHVSDYYLNRKEMKWRYYNSQGNLLGRIVSWFSRWSCNHGQSFRWLGVWTVLIVLLPAVLYPSLDLTHETLGPITYSQGPAWILQSLIFSVAALTGLGADTFTVQPIGEVFSVIQSGLGVVLFGLFIMVFTRKVNR